MARQTFQGRMRTFSGRHPSAIDIRYRTPRNMLAQNLAGPIQIVMNDPAGGEHEVGFLPAFWAIERIRVITPAGAGTIRVDAPAYNGLAAVPMVAALASATDVTADMTLIPPMFSSFSKDRPLVIETTGVTGLFALGIFGFPLDDGTDQGT